MLTATLCAALTAGGLAISVVTAYRRRFLAATRTAAVSLLPLGLALAGLVTLGRKVGTAVADWAADLVLKPTVWTGFGVLACSALLFMITRLVSGRSSRGGRVDGAGAGAVAAPSAPTAASGGTDRPALPAGRPAAKRRSGSGGSGLSEFADVEEILKRRGI